MCGRCVDQGALVGFVMICGSQMPGFLVGGGSLEPRCLSSLCKEGIYGARTPGILVKGVPVGPGCLGLWPMSCHPWGGDSSTLPGLYWDTAGQRRGDCYLVPSEAPWGRQRSEGRGGLAAVPEHRVHFVIKEVTSVPAR